MKTIALLFTIALQLNTTFFSQEKLPIDLKKSSIKWIGEYTFYFGGHEGFIKIKEGYLVKKNNVISGGEFVIDMNSITNTDIKKKDANEGLVNHLKDPDFFDVKKFPLAKISITKVEYSDKNNARFEANLTIKGITKPINFQAELNHEKKELKTRFKIDRTAWNVNYKSKFKDGAISDAIGFEVLIKL